MEIIATNAPLKLPQKRQLMCSSFEIDKEKGEMEGGPSWISMDQFYRWRTPWRSLWVIDIQIVNDEYIGDCYMEKK